MTQQLSKMRQTLASLDERLILHQLFPILDLPELDWEVGYWDLWFADHTQVKKYCRALISKSLSDDQKFALMTLIVASYAELLSRSKKQNYNSGLWRVISGLIEGDCNLYGPIVDHWCNFRNADLETGAPYFMKFDTHQVTILMRELQRHR